MADGRGTHTYIQYLIYEYVFCCYTSASSSSFLCFIKNCGIYLFSSRFFSSLVLCNDGDMMQYPVFFVVFVLLLVLNYCMTGQHDLLLAICNRTDSLSLSPHSFLFIQNRWSKSNRKIHTSISASKKQPEKRTKPNLSESICVNAMDAFKF